MHVRFNTMQNLLLISLATSLMSCKSNRFFETEYDVNTIIQLDEKQNINQSVDLLLHYPHDKISDITWLQTSGEVVTILAATSKAISFTPTQAGEYGISVSFTLNETEEQTLEKNIIVENEINNVTARLSHAALAGNKVSYRTELHEDIDISTLTWQQISGPEISITPDETDGELTIFFDAPQVDNDTILSFNVSAIGTDDVIYNDQVAVLVEPANEISDNAYFSDRKATVFPYNPNSPYAVDLVACVYSNTLTSSCTLTQTPLIAEAVASSAQPPEIEDIMDRVVVSHQWMADNFREFLLNNDADSDIKNLLRATTAIVISYDIRPSFYWAATGAIYLDPENLWFTPQERDTINEAADFRSSFGKDLQFVMPWRYIKDNAYANKGYDEATRQTRTSADILYRLSALMYHELAHANDFFPKNEWYTHSQSQRVLDAATSTTFESDDLTTSFPLASQEMFALAQVRFAGETPDATQRSYLPSDIEGFFAPDSASDFYAYSSEREDFAMLFEELMMQNRFSVMRDTAITNQPTTDPVYASDYIVSWGQRGRIGDDNLRERVIFSATRILPEFDSQTAMESVAAPIPMRVGEDWVENLTLSTLNDAYVDMDSSESDDNSEISSRGNIHINEKVITGKSISGHNKPEETAVPALSGDFTRYYHKNLPIH